MLSEITLARESIGPLPSSLITFSPTDLTDFEKPAKVEEMVREVERMRAKAAKRPPLRVVQVSTFH